MIISVLESLWITFPKIFNNRKYKDKLIDKFWNKKCLGFYGIQMDFQTPEI